MAKMDVQPYAKLFGVTDAPKTIGQIETISLDGGYKLRELNSVLSASLGAGLDQRATATVGEKMGLKAYRDQRIWGRQGNVLVTPEGLDSVLMSGVVSGPRNEVVGVGIKFLTTSGEMAVVEKEDVIYVVSEVDQGSGQKRMTSVQSMDVARLHPVRDFVDRAGYGVGGAYRLLAERHIIPGVSSGVGDLLRETKAMGLAVKLAQAVEKQFELSEANERREKAVDAVRRLVTYRPEPISGTEVRSRYDTIRDNIDGDTPLALWLLDQSKEAFVEAGGIDFAHALRGQLESCIFAINFKNKYQEFPGNLAENRMVQFFDGGGDEGLAKAIELKAKIDAMDPPKNIAYTG